MQMANKHKSYSGIKICKLKLIDKTISFTRQMNKDESIL